MTVKIAGIEFDSCNRGAPFGDDSEEARAIARVIEEDERERAAARQER